MRDIIIKRQQAEIKRLKQEVTELQLKKEMYRVTVDEVRAEAVKEFAEKIFNLFPSDKKYTTISRFAVEQIIKEMTEKEGGKG